MNTNWHTQTINSMAFKPYASLVYIIQDCKEVLKVTPKDNPKIGQYMDEMGYAHAELRRRGMA